MGVDEECKRFEKEVENKIKWKYAERHAFGRIRQELKSIPEEELPALVDEMISVSKVNGELIEYDILIDKYIVMLKPYESYYRKRLATLTSDLMSNDCKYMQEEQYEIAEGKSLLNFSKMKKAIDLLTEARDSIKEFEELTGKKMCSDTMKEITERLEWWKGVEEKKRLENEKANTVRQEMISLMKQLDELCSCNKSEYNFDNVPNGALETEKKEIAEKIAIAIKINELIKKLPHTSIFGCLKHDNYSDLLDIHKKLVNLNNDYEGMDVEEREYLKTLNPLIGKENLSFEEKASILESIYRDAYWRSEKLREEAERAERKRLTIIGSIVAAIVVVIVIAICIVIRNKKKNKIETQLTNQSQI